MAGFDKDNIPSDITNSITTGSNAGILLQPPMVKEITAVTTPTKDNTPSYTFKSSKAGTITSMEAVASVITHLQLQTTIRLPSLRYLMEPTVTVSFTLPVVLVLKGTHFQ